MKTQNIYLLISSLVLVWSSAIAASVDCNAPCGPDEVLYCVGKTMKPAQSPTELWNSSLYGTNSQDNFCETCSTEPLKHYDDTLKKEVYTVSPLQADYCKKFCQTEKGSYFSYDNFLKAYQAMQNSDSNFSIACTGTLENRKKELANLLATSSAETKGGVSNSNDGLYFRYENSWLLSSPDGQPCMDWNCQTNYYGDAKRTVVAVDKASGLVYTAYYWDNGTIGSDGKVSGNKVNLSNLIISVTWVDNDPGPDPDKYKLIPLSDPSVVLPGYWVGMGNIQLTGPSMMGFFGWYYNHIASPSQVTANLQSFIDTFLVDGQLGFQGGFWYWNYRIVARGDPTLHHVLNSTGQVCHDIAISTRMVNGGCNNYDSSRKPYYNYFTQTVLGLTLSSICMDKNNNVVNCTGNPSLDYMNSMICYYSDDDPLDRLNRLQNYCYNQPEIQ